MNAPQPLYPDLHPRWCDELYVDQPCETHVGSIGLVELAEGVHLVALLDDSGPARGLVVTVSVLTATAEVNHRVILDPPPAAGKRERKQHAFTIERTRGDAFVWRCRCGFVLVQDSAEVAVQADLIAHATGGAR